MVETSKRPVLRPNNLEDQTKKTLGFNIKPSLSEVKEGVVTTSLKPKLRPDYKKMTEDFGNLEFRADLDKQLSWNPLARLGYQPNKTKVLKTDSPSFYAAYDSMVFDPDGTDKSLQDSAIRKGFPKEEAKRLKAGDVFVTSDTAFNPVFSHEYTHVGLEKVFKLAKKNPKTFKEKYGEDAYGLIVTSTDDYIRDEYLTELFDDLTTKFNSLGLGDSLKVSDKFPNKSIAFTTGSNRYDNKFIGTREIFQDAIKNKNTKIKKEDVTTFNKNLKGIFGVMDAAQDILTEQGEPPKAKRKEKELSYFEQFKKALGFAQGGLADMNTQTQRAFALGGEAETAETVDPVSGNDVPPGSLPEEVRDDIDAKLSEGEYVVPADVVRYYGVKFFENLRTKAKQGLQQMDEDGRIGGEPTSEMFLPFDVSELEVEDENGVRMAVGGLVPGYYVGGGVGSSFGGGWGYGDPFKTPTVVKPPEPVAPVTPSVPSTGSYVRTYYDRYGNPVSIMFINGQPQQSLEGLTTSNPDRTDTVQENQRFEGAKLNDLGQPIDKYGNIITASSSGGFNLPSFGFGTSAAEEFDYAKTLADETDLDRYKKIGAYASGELAKNKPSLLGRIGQTLISVGVGAIAGPAAGLIAGQAYGINKNQQNIADAQLSLKVLESQYTGKDINATGATVGYKPDPPQSKNASIKAAYDALKEELENIADQNPSFFKQAMGYAAPNIDARFKKLGLKQKATTADAIIAENQQGVKSAAELAKDARLGLARTKWAGQPKKNVSWNQTGPTNETYEKYVNIGRQSERITARGQVMRTQADAFNQNRADDQAAATKRAGDRAAARRAANSRDGYTDKQGKTHRTGQDAVDAFNRDNADDIRTKYGGNKETDSNGQNSGCFLTTAIVEHRGESDDGPTLTKLRYFRDTYLVDYPEEIKKYYNIAPKIVAAIPKNNPEWDWVGTQIDSAIQDIDNNMPDKAHKTYKNMVLKLETNWLN